MCIYMYFLNKIKLEVNIAVMIMKEKNIINFKKNNNLLSHSKPHPACKKKKRYIVIKTNDMKFFDIKTMNSQKFNKEPCNSIAIR